jgi:rhodanese-related sulfurtransferase
MIVILNEPNSLERLMKEMPYLPGILIAAVCLILMFVVVLPRLQSWLRGRGRPVLDPVQVEELLTGSGALVVDLRSPEAFRTGHVRGSLHLPFPELATRFTQPDPTAKRAIVLVDETDALAHQAYDLLVSRGFTWVYVLKGGIQAWRGAHRPLAK